MLSACLSDLGGHYPADMVCHSVIFPQSIDEQRAISLMAQKNLESVLRNYGFYPDEKILVGKKSFRWKRVGISISVGNGLENLKGARSLSPLTP